MIFRQPLLLLAITGLIFVGAGIGIYAGKYPAGDEVPSSIPGLLWPNPKTLQAFSTIDQSGNTFNLEQLKGKWSLLFFGYTHCPDVCPMTLSILSSVQDRLPAGVQTLFISVDPVRDTTQRLAEYIGFYDTRMIGLGGTLEQVSALAAQIGVAWGHGEPTADGSYVVTHSSAVFLTDPEARLVGIFSAPLEPDTLLSSITGIVNFVNQQK